MPLTFLKQIQGPTQIIDAVQKVSCCHFSRLWHSAVAWGPRRQCPDPAPWLSLRSQAGSSLQHFALIHIPPIPISDHYCSKSFCVPTAGNMSQEHLKHLKPSPSEPAGGEPSCARSQFPSSSSMCKVFMTATLPAQGSRSPREPLGAGVRQTINNCVCHGAWTARTAL